VFKHASALRILARGRNKNVSNVSQNDVIRRTNIDFDIVSHEGRNWYSSHRGRLWIASAAKVPSSEEISNIKHTYRTLKNGW